MRIAVAALALLIAIPATAADRPVSAEQAIHDAAPALLDALKSAGVKRFGVLRVTADKDATTGTHNPAPLLARLTRDLEAAVVLRMKPKDADRLVLLRDASTVAARLKGANHTTEAGRKALFAAKYPRSWGDGEEKADAFLTATVAIKDGRDLVIRPRLVTPDSVNEIGSALTAFADVDALIDMGVSFSMRGKGTTPVHGLKDGTDAASAQAGEAAKVLSRVGRMRKLVVEGVNPPAPLDEMPLSLTILYDGTPQTVRYDRSADRSASVAEPAEAVAVTFVVRRRDPADRATYGFVLRVNGINTVGRQRAGVSECRRWVLGPDDRELTIDGFYTPAEGKGRVTSEVVPFRVASAAETRRAEAERWYGDDLGTIDFAVFRSATPAEGLMVDADPSADPLESAKLAKALRTMRRGAAELARGAADLETRKVQQMRGVILDDGPTFLGEVRKVEFLDPVIIGSARIVYRDPAGFDL